MESHEQIKVKPYLGDIKADFFLLKLFDALPKVKCLKLIKYNKSMQNRLNKGIKDFKEYTEIYSPIEIEIIPAKNKYGKFINIPYPEKKSNFHIFFDNNKNEIQRNYLEENESIDKIKIIIDYQVKSLKGLFSNCTCIDSIKFKKFYRTNINNMENIFSYCSSLKELDLSKFRTDNITNMNGMFEECSSLKELDLCNFNTDKVTKMKCIFKKCSSLIKLDLNNFNTNKVKDMSGMFDECSSLEELNLTNFNTRNVTNMSYMFFKCSSLKELDISKFDITNVDDMEGMFWKCSEELKNKIKGQKEDLSDYAF